MALLAVAIPILPGKTDQWRRMTAEFAGARREQFIASRAKVGVRERTFLQHTPDGDMAIVTFEGDDPTAAMTLLGQQDDDFARWFIDQVREIHGIDLTSPPEDLPQLITDTGPV